MTGRLSINRRSFLVTVVIALVFTAAPSLWVRGFLGSAPAYATGASTWTAGTGAAPSSRHYAAMAYDRAHAQTVLFGGGCCPFLNDTWTWNGTTWSQQFPAAAPSPRQAAAMAYDRTRGEIVLFGGVSSTGQSLGDTWSWNGTTWTQRSPSTSPPARQGAAMAFDPASGQIVLFGGAAGAVAFNDTWTWNGSNWMLQTPAQSPSSRAFASVATDDSTKTVVLFGGSSTTGALSDTWVWTGSTWLQRSPAVSPPARFGAGSAYDSATGEIVLFGGGCCSFPASSFLSDTWTWDGATWLKESPTASPLGREYLSMSESNNSGRAVLFGGDTGPSLNGDTWSWSPPSGASPFASACQGNFCVGSRQFNFVGWNTWGLAATCQYPASELNAYFQQASNDHISVVRLWLFQGITASGSDYSEFDQVLSFAHQCGVHLFPVLEDSNAEAATCTSHARPFLSIDWYQSGYQSPYAGWPIGYKQYVLQTVARYKDDPSIFAWGLINEPTALNGDGSQSCDSGFYNFFSDMTASVRSSDPNHLITSGSPGPFAAGFACSSPSPDTYQNIFSLTNNNFAEYHDYTGCPTPPQACPIPPNLSPGLRSPRDWASRSLQVRWGSRVQS